jgi:hypothetical protein
MNRSLILIYSLLLLVCLGDPAAAQERVAPIYDNPFVRPGTAAAKHSTAKTTALSLPFFEDFTNYDEVPDTAKWEGRQVYVNNTMGLSPVSRGVATFDGISQYGKPYDTVNPNVLRYADSLTSKVIDLSVHVPADSIYISFFIQPQGNGFAPERADSLILYFRNKGTPLRWTKVWAASDTALRPFRQIMVPVRDTLFLHDAFQFRFVNKVSMGINDDVWNLDYIRMAAGRTWTDTAVNDIAYTVNPGFLLNDYAYMSYRQFLADPAKERATAMDSRIRNNYSSSQTVALYGYNAQELSSGTGLSSDSKTGLSLGAGSDAGISFPVYTATAGATGDDRVVFENKFYLSSPAGEYKGNDTIIHDQVFDNYLAYDDGTAEMSYYLNLLPSLPGKIAVEHHLNRPDTLRGVAIYFGRQVPIGSSKYFSLMVYKSIAYGGVKEELIYQEDNLIPGYRDSINHFWVYKFEKPVALPAGTFFIGTQQPALSGSDSLYFGLDRNRKGGNHAYFNVLNYWAPSLIDGALMIRPLLGRPVSGSVIKETGQQQYSVNISPNPAGTYIEFLLPSFDGAAVCQVLDISGRAIISSAVKDYPQQVDVSTLAPGVYLLKILSPDRSYSIQKFIKQ